MTSCYTESHFKPNFETSYFHRCTFASSFSELFLDWNSLYLYMFHTCFIFLLSKETIYLKQFISVYLNYILYWCLNNRFFNTYVFYLLRYLLFLFDFSIKTRCFSQRYLWDFKNVSNALKCIFIEIKSPILVSYK